MTACRPYYSPPSSIYATMLLAFALLLGGCASSGTSLDAVRQFADASASLGGYKELSQRYRDTYARERAYLSPAADRVARENNARRDGDYANFIAAQQALVLYMQTLAMLAGEARYDLTPELDAIGDGVKAFAGSALERRHVDACTGLTRLLARVIGAHYQGASVATMVRDGGADVRALLDGMMILTRLYAKTHESERQSVLGLFDVELSIGGKARDPLLAVLARAHYMDKVREYQLFTRRYDLALDGLTRVALGHQQMREHLAHLSGSEVARMLAACARDLQLIGAALAGH